jgi:hypothetical protein
MQKKNSLNLPEVVNLKKLQDFTNLRAFADSEALKIKYTNEKIYLENEPSGAMAKSLYAIAEKIRYEKIGSDKLKGVKNNITQCYENKFKDKKIEEIKTEADVTITEAFELYLRSHFFTIKQNRTTKKVLSYWKDLFDKNLKQRLKELGNCIENQYKFNQVIADLIDNLDSEDSDSKEKEEKISIVTDASINVNGAFPKPEVMLPTLYQQYIHLSRYSRYRYIDNRRETWEETVGRYFDFFVDHLKIECSYKLPANIKSELKRAVLELEVMPSMRCLMTAGDALARENVAGYNCSFVAIDSPRAFDEILYILMNGTGVGFSVERQMINELPRIADDFYDTETFSRANASPAVIRQRIEGITSNSNTARFNSDFILAGNL